MTPCIWGMCRLKAAKQRHKPKEGSNHQRWSENPQIKVRGAGLHCQTVKIHKADCTFYPRKHMMCWKIKYLSKQQSNCFLHVLTGSCLAVRKSLASSSIYIQSFSWCENTRRQNSAKCLFKQVNTSPACLLSEVSAYKRKSRVPISKVCRFTTYYYNTRESIN